MSADGEFGESSYVVVFFGPFFFDWGKFVRVGGYPGRYFDPLARL